MCKFKFMAYNVENMRNLFSKGKISEEGKKRADSIGETIKRDKPHIVGIVEASDKNKHHEEFLKFTGMDQLGYKIARGHIKRGKQDLAFYYRAPFELISIDLHHNFYLPWIEDIDDDGIKEVCEFERIPLEAKFRLADTDIAFTIVLVAAKSKGVFAVKDLLSHQYLGLGNRKKLYAQAKKLRERADNFISSQEDSKFIIMGDMNDEPGMDPMERLVGASAIETIAGSVFKPENILHNALWHMNESPDLKKELWTNKYPDMIVQNFKDHKAWLDHIFISPALMSDSRFSYIKNSGNVSFKDEVSTTASDHFPVHCSFELKSEAE